MRARAAGVAVARSLAGADHVQRLVVRREADAVGILELILGDHLIEPAARIPAIHRVRQFALRAADRAGVRRADARVEQHLADWSGRPARPDGPRTAWSPYGGSVNQMLPSGCGTRSFGEFSGLPSNWIGDHRHRAVVFPADHATEEVLGGKLAPLEVERVAVAVVRRLAERRHPPIVPQQAILRVALHVAEHEVLALARPGRPFRPRKPVATRWIAVMPTRSAANDGSMTMMSGSG